MSDTTTISQTPTIAAPAARILIAVIEPQKPVRLEFMDRTYEAMVALVGGRIDRFPIVINDTTLLGWCNDEFLFNGSEPSRYNPATCQVICGTFFVCGDSEGNPEDGRVSVSLTPPQVEIIAYLFGPVEGRELLLQI